MNKIAEYLNICARSYYAGDPMITDDVFDALADSINYHQIGHTAHDHIEKHYYPMYSLQKHYEDEGKLSPLKEYSEDKDASPKLDGAAISVLYINGELARVLTRGDGVEGTVITDKFIGSILVPQNIPINGIVQVTGEIAAPKHIENARNYAAGSLSLKDTAEFHTRAVKFFAYGVYPFLTTKFSDDMAELKKMGFDTIKDPELHNIYPCDGVVFRINSNILFMQLGYTSTHPRGAYALKERGEAVLTTLLGVEWNTSKSGRVNPVAILAPVKIGDAMVSRATLNNIGFIRALDLRVGDTVGVIKGGDIIPCITHKVT